jgi:hypothetical protein
MVYYQFPIHHLDHNSPYHLPFKVILTTCIATADWGHLSPACREFPMQKLNRILGSAILQSGLWLQCNQARYGAHQGSDTPDEVHRLHQERSVNQETSPQSILRQTSQTTGGKELRRLISSLLFGNYASYRPHFASFYLSKTWISHPINLALNTLGTLTKTIRRLPHLIGPF